MICYNKASNKFFPKNGIDPDAIRRAGSERPREYTVPYVNELIRTAVENGYLVSYNHPVWSMEDEERILSYENIFSLEIENYGSHLSNHMEYSGRCTIKCSVGGSAYSATAETTTTTTSPSVTPPATPSVRGP